MDNPYLRRLQRNNLFPRNGETWTEFYARCDSDGNPEGGDCTAPSRSDDSAGRDSGIAQPEAQP